jgi:ankyrin repeat protein
MVDQEEDDPDQLAVIESIRESMKSQADETFTALTYAARSGDIEEVSSLIHRGAQIDHVDYDGRGALAMVTPVHSNFFHKCIYPRTKMSVDTFFFFKFLGLTWFV